ncbi:hypothetical protein B0T26DRAFT_371225 [Lasiosphaeria miniovina]|uniref:Uncharacterized protein n=1 Tax=Lasiosphaeria miniovina TaxID=1954250 RepID=A0AA40ADF7_9PEZI|nr:uncharacterized protein B0T26DRAFT_371225 [Lasiosphaeria miniovina]KAK0713785.1 hypothetical protein B0T26DRAFT_371225 [Lasiosphaeria miniovina]
MDRNFPIGVMVIACFILSAIDGFSPFAHPPKRTKISTSLFFPQTPSTHQGHETLGQLEPRVMNPKNPLPS